MVKNPPGNAGDIRDVCSVPGSGKSPEGENGNPVQYLYLENPMDIGTCLPMQETWVQFLGREDPLEKEVAAHSSILVWRIPRTEEPGGLQSMRSKRVD